MLSATSPLYQHLAQNLALIFLSLLFLPVSTAILLACLSFQPFAIFRRLVHRLLEYVSSLRAPKLQSQRPYISMSHQPSQSQAPSTILVTGVSMTKGLYLSRIFSRSGHRVIGADFSAISPGRFSNSLSKYYTLPSTTGREGPALYIAALIRIIQNEGVHLWVSCSGVASEVDDGRAKDIIARKTSCSAIQFSAFLLDELHEKDKFMDLCERLGMGDAIPETHHVTSRDSVHRLLHKSSSPPAPPKEKLQTQKRGKKYILKSVGVNDATRSDMTLLPRRTASLTYDHVARVRISPSEPMILQQFVKGREYCSHSLVVRGEIKAFVACPSSDMLMHYKPLPLSEPLSRAMLRFTRTFAQRLQEEMPGEEVTGHLSFDFLVQEVPVTSNEEFSYGTEWKLKCIECNPRPHTAVALFSGLESELSDSFTSALTLTTPQKNGHAFPSGSQPALKNKASFSSLLDDTETLQMNETAGVLHPLANVRPLYWVGHDIATLFLLPLLHFLNPFSASTLADLVSSSKDLLSHLLLWQDPTFSVMDPIPWWWTNHPFWLFQLGECIWSLVLGKGSEGRWSRLNVSTGKKFGC